MDGRIGIIQRGEKQVFYGFLNDKFESMIERDTPEEVLAVLDGRVAPIRVKRGKVRRPDVDFVVTLTVRFPAWDEVDGIKFDVVASTVKEAIKAAKRQAELAGFDRHSGKKTFTARRK